ncbi:cell adhesion molecule CEACAM6-like [Urocitellus parryii]
MQPPSACPCRGGIPWQGVLLAVSLLTFWNLHPTAQLTIEPVPSNVAEGRDVLLLVHNVLENTVGYFWFRGQITNQNLLIVSYSNLTHSATQGPAFSGRETVYPNGSLLFVNVTKGDTGFYTLQTTTPNFQIETATGEFRVHEKLPKPNITINNSQPMEGEDSLALTCEPEVNYATYLTLVLFNVTRNDTGPYECETQNPVSASRSDPLTLSISWLVAQPSLRATNTEPHSVAMTCLSGGPGLSITWILNSQTLQLTDRMQLSPDHRTLRIDPVRQEDAGEYQCEASNPASSTRSDRYRLAVIWPVSSMASETTAPQYQDPAKVPLTAPPPWPQPLATELLFPSTSGRETIYPNGSLLFVNLTKEDTGFYTLQTTTPNFDTEAATGEFRVHEKLPKPNITINNSQPMEGLVAQPSLRATNTEPHSVALTCLSGDPGISITWILNSQTLQLTDRMQLSPDHRTLTIDPVRQEDAGEYQCEASNPASSTRSDRYRLAVIWPVSSKASETTAPQHQDPAKVPLTAPHPW